MIHYPELLKQNGPFVDCSTYTSERKHRQGKLYAYSSNSRVHLPLSVSVKLQLQFVQHLLHLSCNPLSDFKVLSALKSVRGSTLDSYQYFSDVVDFNENNIVNVAKVLMC